MIIDIINFAFIIGSHHGGSGRRREGDESINLIEACCHFRGGGWMFIHCRFEGGLNQLMSWWGGGSE